MPRCRDRGDQQGRRHRQDRRRQDLRRRPGPGRPHPHRRESARTRSDLHIGDPHEDWIPVPGGRPGCTHSFAGRCCAASLTFGAHRRRVRAGSRGNAACPKPLPRLRPKHLWWHADARNRRRRTSAPAEAVATEAETGTPLNLQPRTPPPRKPPPRRPPDKPDTVWIAGVFAALVIFMTLPGLALFYGGLVRSARTCCRS
jgi:hypothetical protein